MEDFDHFLGARGRGDENSAVVMVEGPTTIRSSWPAYRPVSSDRRRALTFKRFSARSEATPEPRRHLALKDLGTWDNLRAGLTPCPAVGVCLIIAALRKPAVPRQPRNTLAAYRSRCRFVAPRPSGFGPKDEPIRQKALLPGSCLFVFALAKYDDGSA
jgi:hypothetical protein